MNKMQFEFDEYGMQVTRPGRDSGSCSRVETGQCFYCDAEMTCLNAPGSYNDDHIPVCRTCVTKIFGAYDEYRKAATP